MSALLERPRFDAVDRDIGTQIARRRTRLGMNVSQLAKAAGVDRGSISKIESGQANSRDSTIGTLNTTLDRLEHELGMDLPAAPSELAAEGLVEFTISGSFGVSIIMKGPVRNMSDMEAAASRIVEKMQVERRDKNSETN